MGIMGREQREENDLYCTNPIAVEKLLNSQEFCGNIWEICSGLGHIADTLQQHGYAVRCSDIIPYTPKTETLDILQFDGHWNGDIITNPPYHNADDFIYKAMDIIDDGHLAAMYMKINFLSSKKRYELFTTYPPKIIYIMSTRLSCAKNGDFEKYKNGAVDYCWIVWEKGYQGDTTMQWIE